MSSTPRYHRAGSAASTSLSSSIFVSAVPTISSESSGGVPSRIPTAKRLVPTGNDNDLTKCDNHDNIHISNTESRAKDNRHYQTVDSELVRKIKNLESYERRAISAENELEKERNEKINLEGDVKSLCHRVNAIEKGHSQLEAVEREKNEIERQLKSANEQLITERLLTDNLRNKLSGSEDEKSKLKQALDSSARQLKDKQDRQVALYSQLENMHKEKSDLEEELKLRHNNEQSLQVEVRSQLETIQRKESDLEEVKQQLNDERTHRIELKSQLETTGIEKSNLEKEIKQHLVAKENLLEERYTFEKRCEQLDGLLEIMSRLGATLEDIKRQQKVTDNRVLCLGEEKDHARQDHLDIINQYGLHFGNMKELEDNYGKRNDDLETRIAILQAAFHQSNNSSQELLTKVETMAMLLTKLPEQLESLIKDRDHPVQYASNQLQCKVTEAIAEMSHTCSQLLVNHESLEEVQAEYQTLEPPIPSSMAESSAQSTRKGQTQVGLYRKKGETKSQLARYTTQPMSNVTPVLNAPS
ncbi:hypothetical protein BDW62DRAFT_197704 [Aspergillus aurantiobrunneus]